MGSVLNGLGKTSVTFLHNLVSLLVRLAFVFFGIPRAGIRACLWGMLAGELVLSLLHLYSLRRLVRYAPNAWAVIVKPSFCLASALGIFSLFPDPLHRISSIFAAVPQKAGSLVKFHSHIKAPVVFHDLFYHALAAF